MRKIGVGVTSFNRPECLGYFKFQLEKNPPASRFVTHYAENIPNVALAKNHNLVELFEKQECDAVFLFDDDCFPVLPDWDLPFLTSGFHHCLLMNENYLPAQRLDSYTRYRDAAGCFMYITRELWSSIGYFNEKYSQYGYEHLGYSTRARQATKDWGFICLNETSKYIYSLDLDGSANYSDKVHHSSCLDRSLMERLKKENHPIFIEEITQDELFYGTSLL